MWSSRRCACVALLLFAAAGCGRTKGPAPLSAVGALDAALVPAGLAANLRRAGGGHFHATATLRADLAKPGPAGGKPASPPAVTTTTDLWMDKAGNFRLTETNDQDGGRDIVRVGDAMAVALRYGKLVRRPAQDAESQRYLGEALGAPWMAWELVRRQVAVEEMAGPAWRLKLAPRPTSWPPGFPAAEGLRRWRDTVVVKNLDGQVTLDAAAKLPATFACQAGFHAERDGAAIAGEVAVTAMLDQIGTVAEVAMPEAETLRVRQRTVLEERALLGGLTAGGAAAAKKATP